jgi:predicted RNA-binding Zn-ribbon protein involved in translation (DUF1610 family)
MTEGAIKFCPQCGADNVTISKVTPSHILELYCPHCGLLTLLLCEDHALIGTNVSHDPDSDAESW